MKFHLAINLERMNNSTDMQAVQTHTLDMVQQAEAGGFETAWAAEHHALEMTIAPNPFQILTWWASHTNTIRLGSGVANAAYWHPIGLAGEAALLDVISAGRLEFGIGSGAYQREFDRMKPGLKQSDSWRYMHEMLPLVQKLWQGDVVHNGEYWQFPKSTACPKPIQKKVPVWVAARSPITFDYAVANQCHIMSWPLTRAFSEAELYKQQLDTSITKYNTGFKPNFALMRHSCVYGNDKDHRSAIDSVRCVLGQFENLMRQMGDVNNGFPDVVSLEQLAEREQYQADMLTQNLMFGKPDEVIAKLKRYQDLGADAFIYYASMGLDRGVQKRSMDLFINEVMPAFNQ